jgi:hypothetical protein
MARLSSNATKLGLQVRSSVEAGSMIGFFAVLLLFTALTVLFFWECIPQLQFRLIGPPEDNMNDLWNSWYAATSRGPDFFFTNMLKFPNGTSLHYHSFAYPQIFAVRFLSRFFGTELPTMIILQNATLLASFALAGTGAYYLVHHFVPNPLAALLGGFVFAFNPSHVAHVMHHAHVSSIEFIPFFLVFYLTGIERRSVVCIGTAIIFYALSALSCWYYLFYIAYFILFHAIYVSLSDRALPRGWDIACPSVTLVGAAALLSPLLIPMVREAMQGSSVYAEGMNTYVADIAAYPAFPPTHLLAPVSEWLYRRLEGNSWEATVYLGLVNLALLALVWRRVKGADRRLLNYVLWGMAVFCAFASGATLHILGNATLPMPGALLSYLPFFANLRTPSRAIVFVYVFMAVGVGHSFSILWPVRERPPFRYWVGAVAVAALVLSDFYPAHLSTTGLACSPGLAVIRDDPDQGFGILNLPSGYAWDNLYMARQLCHGKPIAEGITARAVVQTFRNRLETADMNAQRVQLTNNKIKYIIINRQQLSLADGKMSQYQQAYVTVYEDNELTVVQVY